MAAIQPNPFLTHLAHTCQHTRWIINDDGKRRHLFQRLWDFLFKKQSAKDFFVSTCEKLEKDKFKQLKPEDQMHILFRIKQIEKKLKQDDKNKVHTKIETLEQAFFDLEGSKAVELASNILERLIHSSKYPRIKRQERERDLQQLKLLFQKCTPDQLGKIWEAYQEKLSSNPKTQWENLSEIDQALVNRLREQAEKNPKDALDLYCKVFNNYAEKRSRISGKDTLQEELKAQLEAHVATLKTVWEEKKGLDSDKLCRYLDETCKLLEGGHRELVVHLFSLYIDIEKYEMYAEKFFHFCIQTVHRAVEIERNLKYLLTVLEKRDNDQLIKACLKHLDLTLQKQCFSTSLMPRESWRRFLGRYQKVFDICNQYIDKVDDDLKRRLKIKLANLPCENRDHFPNVALTKKEQNSIMVDSFEKREGELIDKITGNETFSVFDCDRLARLVHSDSSLSEDNRKKLRNYIANILDEEEINWDDRLQLIEKMVKKADLNKVKLNPDIETLKRDLKARQFFQGQATLDEKQIQIPRWYHATKPEGIQGIITSKTIKVTNRGYRGAWVSSQPEGDPRGPFGNYGQYVIAMNNGITTIDAAPSIRYEFPTRRWRGLQQPIPTEKQHISFVAVPRSHDKPLQRFAKRKFAKMMEGQGLHDIHCYSYAQMDYIRKRVVECLGAPNLSLAWWGRDV